MNEHVHNESCQHEGNAGGDYFDPPKDVLQEMEDSVRGAEESLAAQEPPLKSPEANEIKVVAGKEAPVIPKAKSKSYRPQPLDDRDIRRLAATGYEGNADKYNTAFVILHRKTGKIAELWAVSDIHACQMLRWNPKHVKVLRTRTREVPVKTETVPAAPVTLKETPSVPTVVTPPTDVQVDQAIDEGGDRTLKQMGPESLRLVHDAPSDINTDVTNTQLQEALLTHCKTSAEQVEELQKAE